MDNYCWIPVTERLPEKSNYDWVLVQTKFVPKEFLVFLI